MKDVHEIWYGFCSYMEQWYFDGQGLDISALAGDEAIQHIDDYARDHPEIKIVPVDDSYFESGILVLVPHPSMGITTIFIPSSSPHQNTFFLYPGHFEMLKIALNQIGKEVFDAE